ncbi:MAG: hypothetical protein SOW18_01090 [Peptoniphilus sp.]|nr:hypothetical protein [Peptoniphilus sp.]MDY3118115.1 hypothetical protein [Peptoniphilus sp.]
MYPALDSGLHAYILKGSGEAALKETRRIAMGFLCSGEEKPCGRCPSCRLFLSGEGRGENHPDYMEIAPSKKTSKASIKKERMEEVLKEAAMTDYGGGGKVFVFVDFDTATVEGQNALLKILEEPPTGTRFLLLSAAPEKILPTVRSRAGFLDLRARSEGVDPERRHRTLRLLEKVFHRPEEVFLARHFFDEEKEHLDEVFDAMLSYFRDLAVLYETEDGTLVENKDYRTPLLEQAEEIGPRVYDMVDALAQTRRYIEMNVNKSFAFEWLLLTIGGC